MIDLLATVSADGFTGLSDSENSAFWTTLPIGFAWGVIIFCMSASISFAFRLVKTG